MTLYPYGLYGLSFLPLKIAMPLMGHSVIVYLTVAGAAKRMRDEGRKVRVQPSLDAGPKY